MNIKIYQDDLPNNFELEGDIAIDTETMGLNLHRDKLCLLQFSNSNGEAHLVHFVNQDYTAPNLRALLLDKTRCKIFHFARFDLAAIKKYLSIDLENIFCTKISSKLVRTYTDSHGLKDLCRELLSINISKQQQSSYWGAKNLSLEQQEYAAKDVLYLHQLKDILQKMLLRENRLELAQDIFRFLPTRANLDLIGWNEIDIFMH
ncbi:MAG: ribonuclease D [Rickettsia endosymbiont of Sceptobius lativentris]|nr:ribonuclease D [Rickettsia endosymbiont of Sceptobius lativentris]